MEHRQLAEEMRRGLEGWLRSVDYSFYECNYVPPRLLSASHRVNALMRTCCRLNPFRKSYDADAEPPLTPQTTVALLKATLLLHEPDMTRLMLGRIDSLRSPKTANFALRQGITIAIRMYENSADDPTPLNTVWFGQCLLDDTSGAISGDRCRELLYSICAYLTDESGYADFGDEGVYFYYGPTLKKVIFNASALISAFLIRVGDRYADPQLIALGERGIRYIINNQNADGSWYYAKAPERRSIDSFHQSYILQALASVRHHDIEGLGDALAKGDTYYSSLLADASGALRPRRYDKRFTPLNTWLFVRTDCRDVTEAIIYYCTVNRDKHRAGALVSYLYRHFYDPATGTVAPEIFVYGRNRNPYIEFQAWALYALALYHNTFTRQTTAP